MRIKHLRWAALPAVVGASALISVSAATAASGPRARAASAAASGKIVIDNESGSTWTCQFNPFNPAVTFTSFGFTYEPLEFLDTLAKSAKKQVTPWLATSSKWSKNFKTLTFTIRKGVKWSDGKPFSAADVAYTFNAMKHDKAIDLNAIWKADGGPLTGVSQKGSKVIFKFDAPSEPYFYFVADQTPIVPKHIWAKLNQHNLQMYKDPNPVGTGPYTVSSCSPQNIKYLSNPGYWQSRRGHVVPAIREVDYPAFLSNTPANLALSQGQAQWGGQYVPNIKSFYINKDPSANHFWFPPVMNVSLVPNLTNPLLKQLPVREAIEHAINRKAVSRLGESSYEPPANQTGVIVPTFNRWFNKSLKLPGYNPKQSIRLLEKAGFKRGANGIFKSKSGQPLSFTIRSIAGFSDWDASLQVIVQELKKIGIAATVADENSNTYTTHMEHGDFQLAYAGSGGPDQTSGPAPYYELRGDLFSGNIGSTNFSRFDSHAADALFDAYPASTPAKQVQIMHKLEKIMATQIPFIPVTEGVDWFQYNTAKFKGWPTAANPYAQPSPYQPPDMGVVLTHLSPK